MKLRFAWLAILCLALAVIPAWGQYYGNWTYDNGPINGGTDAWTINFGYIVSDTFAINLGLFQHFVTGFQFGVWEHLGDSLDSVQWSITTGENSGTVYGSGTASGVNLTDQFISTNQYVYDIDKITVSGLNVGLDPNGGTYWLNLYNAVTANGVPVYWDENSGVGCGGNDGKGSGCPSMASESAVGTIPSEAFTISGYCEFSCEATPEPSSIMLFGTGILGLAGVLRRKLNF